jgi:hypothetical protein
MARRTEQPSSPEYSEDIRRAIDAVQVFNKSIPDGLSDEEWTIIFEELEKAPGAGGADLIASNAARIVEVYQNNTGVSLVRPPKSRK